jgi:hypothetical protein
MVANTIKDHNRVQIADARRICGLIRPIASFESASVLAATCKAAGRMANTCVIVRISGREMETHLSILYSFTSCVRVNVNEGRRSDGAALFTGHPPGSDWSCNAREPGNGQVAGVGEDTRPGVFPDDSLPVRPFSISISAETAARLRRKRIAVVMARENSIPRDTSASMAGRRRGPVGIRAEASSQATRRPANDRKNLRKGGGNAGI